MAHAKDWEAVSILVALKVDVNTTFRRASTLKLYPTSNKANSNAGESGILELAAEAKQWGLALAVVDAGADVNMPLEGTWSTISNSQAQ